MISFLFGVDLFDDLTKFIQEEQRPLIVAHGVNCQGAMGSGFGREFAARFPSSVENYKSWVALNKEQGRSSFEMLGQTQWCTEHQPSASSNAIITACCFTQDRYGKDAAVYASPAAIEACLCNVFGVASTFKAGVLMPLIGGGLGGLSAKQAAAVIEKTYRDSTKSKPVVRVYCGKDAKHSSTQVGFF